MNVGESLTRYLTGVWWVREREWGSMEETPLSAAEAEREKLKRLSFDKPGVSEVRTMKLTHERIA